MQVVIMVIGTAAFILTLIYLVTMARLASLLSRETGVQGIGIDGANAQLKLFRVVFLKQELDKDFSLRHAAMLGTARWSGGIGFVLMIPLFVGILLGYAG